MNKMERKLLDEKIYDYSLLFNFKLQWQCAKKKLKNFPKIITAVFVATGSLKKVQNKCRSLG